MGTFKVTSHWRQFPRIVIFLLFPPQSFIETGSNILWLLLSFGWEAFFTPLNKKKGGGKHHNTFKQTKEEAKLSSQPLSLFQETFLLHLSAGKVFYSKCEVSWTAYKWAMNRSSHIAMGEVGAMAPDNQALSYNKYALPRVRRGKKFASTLL